MKKRISVTIQIPKETDNFYRQIAEANMVSKASIMREALVRASRAAAGGDPIFKAALQTVLSNDSE